MGRGTDAAEEPRQGSRGHLMTCVAEDTGQPDPDDTRISNDRRLTAALHQDIMPTGRLPMGVCTTPRPDLAGLVDAPMRVSLDS